MLRRYLLTFVPLAMASAADWPYYGGDAGTSRYSPLKQINTTNAADLQVAWTFHTGDSTDRPATQIQCTPIVVDGIMYVTSAQLKVIALRATTGEKLWSYDPFAGSDDEKPRGVNRGVSYWTNGKDKRILFTYRSRLVSLDAKTGKPAGGFGDNGQVDLTHGLDRDITGLAYYITTPGVVYKDLLILGSTTGEGPRLSAPGHVRAFDIRTGKQKWIFHTIPHPGEIRLRNVVERLVEVLRRDERLGRPYSGRRARHGLSRDRFSHVRFLGRRSRWRQPFWQLHRGAEREDRQARLALSGRTSRRVGLRLRERSHAGNARPRRKESGRARAGVEDGLRVRLRPRHRQAAVPDRRASRAAVRRAR
jgi:outer membrane protein assembly factor BamB